MILHAWLTLPSCLASSNSPTLARMIFCSVVMVVVFNPPRRGASQPRPLRAPPRLSLCRGDRTPHVRLNITHFHRHSIAFHRLSSAPSSDHSTGLPTLP